MIITLLLKTQEWYNEGSQESSVSEYDPYNANVNAERLRANSYPGSGVVIGLNNASTHLVQVCWLLGRTEQSRRKRLEIAADNVGKFLRTAVLADDGSTVNSYATMRRVRGAAARYDVVTTSDKTDLVARRLGQNKGFRDITETMEPEDDAPYFTPRVTGVVSVDRHGFAFGLAARHKNINPFSGTIEPLKKTPVIHNLKGNISPGMGLAVQAYSHQAEDNSLPSFDGLPYPLPLPGKSLQETAEYYWNILSPEYRVAVAVKALNKGPYEDFRIINIEGQ